MKNIKNIKKVLSNLLIVIILFVGINNVVLAESASINLIIKNNGSTIYSNNVALLPSGTISINDSNGSPHDTNANSVLSVINTADIESADFNISNLIYYSSFNAFYLKCITIEEEFCADWQYKVNDVSPAVGMDSTILSNGENVVLFFKNENTPEPISQKNWFRRLIDSFFNLF